VGKLQQIAAICVVGVLWGTSSAFAESPQTMPPVVPSPTVDGITVTGATSVDVLKTDIYGFPATGPTETTHAGNVPAPAPVPSAAPAPTGEPGQNSIKKMIGILKAPVTPMTPVGDAEMKDVVAPAPVQSVPAQSAPVQSAQAKSPATPKMINPSQIPAEANLNSTVMQPMPTGAEQEIFEAVKRMNATNAANATQQAANVPLDAYQLESNPAPASAPKRVQIPVEPLKQAALPSGEAQFEIALNKTRAVELDRAVRDVIIGNPDIADIVVRAPGEVYLIGRSVGVTNVFLVDGNGSLIRKLEVVVQPDGASVQAALRDLLPKERLSAKGVGDSIVLSGVASTDAAAAQAQSIARRFVQDDANIVNMITIGNEQQVLIRVKVAEMQKSVLKELGASNLVSPQTIGPIALDWATAATGLSSSVFAGTLGISSDDVDATFQLLETQGLLRTLAEPNLLAVSGEPASMLAGGEYPVVAVSDDGSDGTVSVEYKPFGVSLAFLPVVMGPGRIWLKVSTEVSALSQQNSVVVPFGDDSFQILGLSTRRANSTIELPSGGGIMIAGLLQNDIQSSVNGVPGLMDLPILGTLFRSTSFQRNETELVILVSVILAKPTDPDLLAAPTDGFAPSHDLDRYFIGNLQNIYVKKPAAADLPPEGPKGPIGYIIN
jgi:pilus assembly protein CpaC